MPGSAGGNGVNADAGNGGAGVQNSISGTANWYGAGGGGGSSNASGTNSTGGSGIGGNGGRFFGVAASAGTNGTGSGGGGGGSGTSWRWGGAGGSGIVIVRYPTPTNPHSEIIATDGTNVGIGTPTPTAKLSVLGDANKPGGGSWSVFSDERSKENITDYTKGTKELLEIEPKSFQYKEAFGWGTDTHIGLIAQEVEAVVPSMVTTKEVQHIEDFREVDPNELNYMLINAVKELDAKTKALNEAIKMAEQDADAGLEQLRAQAEELKQLKKVLEKHGINTQGSVVRSTTK